VLENEVSLLQKEVNAIKYPENSRPVGNNTTSGSQRLLTVAK